MDIDRYLVRAPRIRKSLICWNLAFREYIVPNGDAYVRPKDTWEQGHQSDFRGFSIQSRVFVPSDGEGCMQFPLWEGYPVARNTAGTFRFRSHGLKAYKHIIGAGSRKFSQSLAVKLNVKGYSQVESYVQEDGRKRPGLVRAVT